MDLPKILVLLWCGVHVLADRPCAPRQNDGQSVYCVCNATYCDTFNKEEPATGQFVTYTTSNSGLRFSKNVGVINTVNGNDIYDMVLRLQPERMMNQSIEGFGGAVTDSAGLNWQSLLPALRQYLVESYFGENGIEYNMLRLPVGSTDFSPFSWTYNSYPINDTQLTNFTLSQLDRDAKIPFIQEILNTATDEVKIVTSTWSPPDWMLNTNGPSGVKSIKKEFYQTYADYHCKFAELYQKQDINIWGMAPINEPLTPIETGITKEFTTWLPPNLAKFISENFGPTIRSCSVKGMKILGIDDQRFTMPLWLNVIEKFLKKESKMDYIDGVALHMYADEYTSPAIIPRALREYPDKFVLVTEACTGATGKDAHKVILGSWDRAKTYIRDILENLNYNVVGWIDWNLCLDKQGGPNWMNNTVDSPIIVDASKQEFYKQPMFYALGHFSKFLPRGSRRIRAVKLVPLSDPYTDIQDIEAMGQQFYDTVAFATPRGTIVVIVHNEGPSKNISIQLLDQVISVELEAESIVTIEFVPQNSSSINELFDD